MRIRHEVLRQQSRADELLGDRGGTAAIAPDRADAGLQDRDRIEAGVVPERLVLDRRGGVDEDLRDLIESDHLALVVPEAGELDLARPVVDDRLLGEDV